MIRFRDVLMVSFIAISSLALSPVYADSNAAETITQAEQDLKSAAQSGAVWRLVDKATGAGAVGIDKLLKLAKKKLGITDLIGQSLSEKPAQPAFLFVEF